MDRKYNVFLVSDSTGETLDRIFLALKAQFENFNNNLHHFSFVRTEAQIATLLEKCNKLGNPIVLYTLVEPAVTAFLIPLYFCFLFKITNKSKILKSKLINVINYITTIY